MNWKDVFQALESVGGTEWYIVEEEAKTCQGFECIERLYESAASPEPSPPARRSASSGDAAWTA